MAYASLIQEATHATILILGVLGFILAIIFRSELKGLLDRLTEVQWKETKVRVNPPADPPELPASESTENLGTPPDDSESDHNPDDEPNEGETVEDAADIRSKMLQAYMLGDRGKGESFFARLAKAETDPTEARRDRARRSTFMFIGGIDTDALDKVREMTSDPDVGGFAHRMTGLALSHAGQEADAADAYGLAADAETSAIGRSQALEGRANALVADGRAQLACDELESAITAETDAGALQRLFGALAAAYQAGGHKTLQAIALHRRAELAGNDKKCWFDAAYAYGNSETPELAPLSVHCYRTALRFDSQHQWSSNNLAVAVANLGMPIPSVALYQHAIEQGNSLAMANVAEKYLRAGFAEDAQRLIDEALKVDDPDEKVTTVAAEIRSMRQSQEQSLSEIESVGTRAASFLSRYFKARFLPGVAITDAPDWTIGNSALKLSLRGRELELEWQEAGGVAPGRRFRGAIMGTSASGRFEKQKKMWPSSAEKIEWEDHGAGYVIISTTSLDLMRLDSKEDERLSASRPG